MGQGDDSLVRHKLDVDDYHRMNAAGILGEDDRVELIDGQLIDMAPIGWDHAATVNGLTRELILSCGDRAIVSPLNPVRLDRRSEPQPDFVVLRPRADGYRGTGTPGPADVLPLIEVADSSLRFDRRVKLPLYARAGVPEVWIVDRRHRLLEAHRLPLGDTHGETATHQPNATIGLGLAPEITVAQARILD